MLSSFTVRGLVVAFLAFPCAATTTAKKGEEGGLRKKKEPSAGLSANCFSGVDTVEVHHKGTVAMKDLQVGDMVKDATGRMVKVYGFGPYQPLTRAEFLQIHAQGFPTPLEVSKGHLVFVNGNAVPASAVQVGDKLDLGPGEKAAVDKIKTVTRSGIYTPFTTSGTVMVSGFAASSYVTPQTNADVLALGDYQTTLSMHWLAHVFHALPRMVCLSQAGHCTSDETLWKWVTGTMHVGKWLKQQHWVVAAVCFVPLFLVGLMLYFVEAIVSNVFVLAFVGATIVAMAKVLRGTKTKKSGKKVVV